MTIAHYVQKAKTSDTHKLRCVHISVAFLFASVTTNNPKSSLMEWCHSSHDLREFEQELWKMVSTPPELGNTMQEDSRPKVCADLLLLIDTMGCLHSEYTVH